MNISIVPIKFHNYSNGQFIKQASFKGNERNSNSSSRNLDNTKTLSMRNVERDYDISSSYLSELRDDISMSKSKKHKNTNADAYISKILGEEYEDSDEFLEKLMY